jgi:O-antigen/teichoic acid export membrane protein
MYLVEQTKWLPLMILAAAGVDAGINVVLIPQVGIIGVAVSTIVAYFVLAAIVTIWARKAISYKLDVLFIGRAILTTGLTALCIWLTTVEEPLSMAFAVVAGLVVYGLVVLLLKTFSSHDIRVFKEIIGK